MYTSIVEEMAFHHADPTEADKIIWRQLKEMNNPVYKRREYEQLIKDVVAEVMKRISVQLKDEASEAVKSLNNEIKKIGGQK
ncbi:MAG: hypothetical protein IJB65_07760 [Clostridia bacterium]|nr:hypothetical protein [Clostridia bacterium]